MLHQKPVGSHCKSWQSLQKLAVTAKVGSHGWKHWNDPILVHEVKL
jgi:hypothetical protein